MGQQYEYVFRYLRDEVGQFSPQAASKLEVIKAKCGVQAAYYAAFVLVCLQAKVETHGVHVLNESISELRSFTFFEYVQPNPEALDLFTEAYDCYRNERQACSAQ